MAGKPQQRPQLEEDRPEHAKGNAQSERLGPVSIERMSKDDGRALIVYRVLGQDAR